MPVVWRPSDDTGDVDGEHVLATTVETADSTLSQMRGLMGRSSIPDDYALAFRFSSVGRRSVHMLFVRFPIDVLWLRDETVVAKKTLSPWTGLGAEKADTLLELPAGAANDVSAGDTVELRDDGA
jgi:hypothetical protein